MIVMLSLPFALVGGIWLMWWLGFNLSVAVVVGFIALAGVAAETGVVMLIYLNHALAENQSKTRCRGPCANPARSVRRHHGRRGRAGAAEDDDGGRHHGRPAADHVEHRHRLRDHAADRSADDRRHDLIDPADADRDSGNLWIDKRERPDFQPERGRRARDESPAGRAKSRTGWSMRSGGLIGPWLATRSMRPMEMKGVKNMKGM